MIEILEYELKESCPFCRGKGIVKHNHYCQDMQFCPDVDEYWCQCFNCGATTASEKIFDARYKQNCKELLDETKLKAIKRWEERV